jgi:hypothetical protein
VELSEHESGGSALSYNETEPTMHASNTTSQVHNQGSLMQSLVIKPTHKHKKKRKYITPSPSSSSSSSSGSSSSDHSSSRRKRKHKSKRSRYRSHKNRDTSEQFSVSMQTMQETMEKNLQQMFSNFTAQFQAPSGASVVGSTNTTQFQTAQFQAPSGASVVGSANTDSPSHVKDTPSHVVGSVSQDKPSNESLYPGSSGYGRL